MPAPRRKIWQQPAPPAPAVVTGEPEITLIRDIAHSLLRAERGEEAFQFALDRAAPVVGASLASVFLLDGASELMRLTAAYGWPERWRPWLGEMRVRIGFGPSGEAVAERRAIEVPDVFADRTLEDWQEVAGELGFRALISLPLITNTRVEGAATFYFVEAGIPSTKVRTLLRAVADLMAVMAEQSALRDRLRRAEAALEELSPPPSLPEPT
jgi:GAF domain-containing protein